MRMGQKGTLVRKSISHREKRQFLTLDPFAIGANDVSIRQHYSLP
jgi:hypothetical protein